MRQIQVAGESSAGDVGLGEDLEAVVVQRLGGDIVVLDVKDESGAAFGAFDEAVNVVDVDLSL